jgi:uncharacterized membrane protein (UPF0127 family)
MRYAIDVVFCDEHWVVRHVVSCMRPQRVSRCVTRARFVVEAPCGALAGRVQRGAQLVVESY